MDASQASSPPEQQPSNPTPYGDPPLRGKHGFAPYALTERSIGWLIAGASRIAAPRFVTAMRNLPPDADANGGVRAWTAAVYSHSPYRAREFAYEHQIPNFDNDLDALLARNEIRCVYVCNHPRHHGQTVLAALRAGKHVLCEPPIALNLEEAHYLHNAAANRGLTLAVNYQHRFDPTIEVLRRMVADHDLGTIVGGYIRNCVLLPPALQTWRIENAWGGVLFDRTLRSVDLLRFLLREEIRSVTAVAGPATFGGEDRARTAPLEDAHTIATMRVSGATFHLHDSYLLPHAPSRVDLFGASGSVTIMPWSETEASAMSIYRHGERLPVNRPQRAHAQGQWERTLLAFDESVRTGRFTLAGSMDDIENLNFCMAIRTSITESIAIQPTLQSSLLQ